MRPDEATDADSRFLAAAARLAMRHVGRTAENPSVGCLIVNDGSIVGRGVTAPGGRPHAERVALDEAGETARGATAYVTLEPCAHHGRTAPCAEALVASGIARVVIGAADPDPRVDGRGVAILRAAGVPVVQIRDADTRAIEGFLSRTRRRRPFLTLKLAVSADGYIGREGSGQVAISGVVSNRQTHLLRARSDLVMIGIGTALADDPQLTVRLDGLAERSPARLVFDPSGRLDPGSRLMRSAGAPPLMVATSAAGLHVETLRERGAILLPLAASEEPMGPLLHALAERGVSSIFCEGGARLAATLLAADLVDRLVLIRSPVPIGAPGIAMPEVATYLMRFHAPREARFGADRWLEYDRRTD